MLTEIVFSRKSQLIDEKRVQPFKELEKKIADLSPARDFYGALKKSTPALIAEIKRASPSAGEIKPDVNITELALIYEKAGAAAVSVLTEKKYFNGELTFLAAIKKVINLPLLRKDFIIDRYQLYQSRVYGADAVLLIAAVLQGKLAEFLALTHELGMEALVEVHTAVELEQALAAGAKIIGINNRNLQTMQTDLSTTENLAPLVPHGVLLVSESGIREAEDVRRVLEAGAKAVLVGESIMVSSNPARKICELKGTEI